MNLNGGDKGYEKSEILDIKAQTGRAKDGNGQKSSGNKKQWSSVEKFTGIETAGLANSELITVGNSKIRKSSKQISKGRLSPDRGEDPKTPYKSN
jgi:pSer/pThr/pTyr-binding forkhead associated (FHA) protein